MSLPETCGLKETVKQTCFLLLFLTLFLLLICMLNFVIQHQSIGQTPTYQYINELSERYGKLETTNYSNLQPFFPA
jgi:hypothetical protein